MANITVIDDDFAAEILAENLRNHGHVVSRVASAQEALNNLNQLLKSDLLILDIIMECPTDMPEAKVSGGRTTGMSIYRRVREKQREIPILAYSATSDRDVIEALRLDPRTRFLAKWSTPSLGELVKTIDKILGLQTRIALPRPFIVHGHDDVTNLAVRLDFLPMETTANSAPCVRFEPVKTKIGGQTTSVLSYTGK